VSSAQYNATTVDQWLQLAYPNHEGQLHICSVGDWVGRTFSREEHGAAIDYAGQLDQRGTPGIYLRATTVRPGVVGTADGNGRPRRGGADDAAELIGLWSDIDIAGPGHKTSKPLPPTVPDAVSIVSAAGLPTPTAWIHSGGGLYAWWLLDQPANLPGVVELSAAAALSSRWQAQLHHGAATLGFEYGAGVSDLARVLRLPGTVNRKTDAPVACQLVGVAGPRYTFDQLGTAVAAVEPPPKPSPKPAQPAAVTVPASPPRVRPEGSESPVDHYNREATAETTLALVESVGWEWVSQDDQYLYVGRPGRSNQHSGSIARAGGGLYVWSDADPLFAQTPRGADAHRPAHVWALAHGYPGGIRETAAVAALGRAGYGDQTPRPVPVPLGTLPAPDMVGQQPAEDERAARRAALRAKLRSSEQLDDLPRPEALIDGLIFRNEVSQIIGASGSLKSFVALSMAGAIGTGQAWFGRQVRRPGPVLFIAAEGATGIRQRVRVWEQQTNAGAPMAGVQFIGEALQIAAKMDRRWVPSWDWELLTEIAVEIGAVALVVDTQARATVGVQESDNTEMGEIFEIVDRMRQKANGLSPILVHHEGKNGNGTGRGASSMYAAINSEIRVTRGGTKETPRLTIANTKNKDAAAADDIHLYAKVWPVRLPGVTQELPDAKPEDIWEHDADGEVVTSLALAVDTSEARQADGEPNLRLKDDDGTRLSVLRAVKAIWAPDGPGFTSAELRSVVVKMPSNPAGWIPKSSFHRIWSELVRVRMLSANGNGARFRVTDYGLQTIDLADTRSVGLAVGLRGTTRFVPPVLTTIEKAAEQLKVAETCPVPPKSHAVDLHSGNSTTGVDEQAGQSQPVPREETASDLRQSHESHAVPRSPTAGPV
jgi:hypothetical protein